MLPRFFDADSRFESVSATPALCTPLGYVESDYQVGGGGSAGWSQCVVATDAVSRVLCTCRESDSVRVEEARFEVAYPQLANRQDVRCVALLVRVLVRRPIDGLTASMGWALGSTWSSASGEPGEHVISRAWLGGDKAVYLGTQDVAALKARQLRGGAWTDYGTKSPAIDVAADAVSVRVGGLEQGDRFQLHFLVASGPSERETELWLMVDRDPSELVAQLKHPSGERDGEEETVGVA